MRGVAAFMAGVATFYFVGWFGLAFLSIVLPDALASVLGFVGSAACGIAAGRYLWVHSGGKNPGVVVCVVMGALVVGAAGFSAGFFGPMILAPEANQGPLLGLFITGPLGVVVGAVGGCAYWFWRRSRA